VTDSARVETLAFSFKNVALNFSVDANQMGRISHRFRDRVIDRTEPNGIMEWLGKGLFELLVGSNLLNIIIKGGEG